MEAAPRTAHGAAVLAQLREAVRRPRREGTSRLQTSHAAGKRADGIVQRPAPGVLLAAGHLEAWRQDGISAQATGRHEGPLVQAEGQAWANAATEAGVRLVGGLAAIPGLAIAAGAAEVQATARVEGGAQGKAKVGRSLLSIDGFIHAVGEVGARARAAGVALLGIDSLGLPGFEFGGAAEGMAGAQGTGRAGLAVSLLGLIRVQVRGLAQGIAGAAGAAAAHLKFRDGDLSVGFGAGGAAGVGGGVGTEVTVGLGKIPRGILQTTVAPILQLPMFALNTIGKALGIKAPEGREMPVLKEWDNWAKRSVDQGLKAVGEGFAEIGEDLGAVASFVGGAVVDGVTGVAKGVGKAAEAVGGAVVDGVTGLAKGVGKAAEAVGGVVVGAVTGIGKGIAAVGEGIGDAIGSLFGSKKRRKEAADKPNDATQAKPATEAKIPAASAPPATSPTVREVPRPGSGDVILLLGNLPAGR